MTKQVETIPFDAIISLEVGGGMYARLHQLLMTMAATKTPEEFKELTPFLISGKERNGFEYNLVTIISLINGLEVSAKEQGKIKMTDLPDQPE